MKPLSLAMGLGKKAGQGNHPATPNFVFINDSAVAIVVPVAARPYHVPQLVVDSWLNVKMWEFSLNGVTRLVETGTEAIDGWTFDIDPDTGDITNYRIKTTVRGTLAKRADLAEGKSISTIWRAVFVPDLEAGAQAGGGTASIQHTRFRWKNGHWSPAVSIGFDWFGPSVMVSEGGSESFPTFEEAIEYQSTNGGTIEFDPASGAYKVTWEPVFDNSSVSVFGADRLAAGAEKARLTYMGVSGYTKRTEHLIADSDLPAIIDTMTVRAVEWFDDWTEI